MNIKTKIAGASLLAMFVVPGISLAQTQSVASLQAELQNLLAEVASLEAQINSQGGSAATWCYTFNSNLSIGMSGSGVSALQTALQKDGESVTVNGIFDDQTVAAVTTFQEKYQSVVLTPYGLNNGTGYTGKLTRGELNSLFGCGNGPSPSSPSSTSMPLSSAVASTTTLTISSLNFTSGPAGMQVVITGTGVGATSTVLMNGYVAATDVPTDAANDTLAFIIPSVLFPNCTQSTSTACPDFVLPVTANSYQVTIISSGLTSNALPFTVTAASLLVGPTITSASPHIVTPGTQVTITGTGFGATSTVLMNGYGAATDVPSASDTLTFTVPQNLFSTCAQSTSTACPALSIGVTPGQYAVTVMTHGGTSNGAELVVPNNSGLPVVAPTISSLSPSSGHFHDAITITGTGFGATSTVLMNGYVASPYGISSASTSLTFSVPTGLSPNCTSMMVCPQYFLPVYPNTTYQVTVFSNGGTSNSFPLLVTPLPMLSSVNPNEGPVGIPVTITGNYFGATSTVLMNGALAAADVSSASGTITFTIPSTLLPYCGSGVSCPGSPETVIPSSYNITVVSNGVTGPGIIFGVFESSSGGGSGGGSPASSPAPSLTSLSPISGSAGTSVTITGTDFGATSTVLMNGLLAASNIVTAGNTITFSIPSSLPLQNPCTGEVCSSLLGPVLQPGAYQVTVASNGETSNALPFTVSSGLLIP